MDQKLAGQLILILGQQGGENIMVRMHFRVTSLVMIAVMSSMTILIQTSMASSLEEQKESLKIIADFAERLCNDIPLKGQGSNLELTGKAKAELNWILKRLI